MTTIEDLPPEIIEKILSYMPEGELLPLTQVKLFNDVVSNSPKLMDRIELKNWILMDRILLRDWKQMEFKRKYRRVRVIGNIESFHVDFLIEHLIISTTYLEGLLTMVSQNLESFELSDVEITVDSKLKPIELKRLKILIIDRPFSSVQRFFENCQLEKLDCNLSYSLKEIDLFGSFIENQKQLKDLTLREVTLNKKMLKILSKTSAEKLEVDAADIKEEVVRIPNVRRLGICGDGDSSPSIESLVRCFPNLEEFKLWFGLKLDFGTAMVLSSEMPRLKLLEFANCEFSLVPFPKVTTLIVNYCDAQSTLNLLYNNKQLVKVKVPRECQDSRYFEAALRGSQIQEIEFFD